jgi:hypothetical protein
MATKEPRKAPAADADKRKAKATRAVVSAGSNSGAPPAGMGSIARSKSARATTSRKVSPEERYRMIAEAAYHRAERRHFTPGGELDDWVAAEVEIDEMLSARVSRLRRGAKSG